MTAMTAFPLSDVYVTRVTRAPYVLYWKCRHVRHISPVRVAGQRSALANPDVALAYYRALTAE